MDVSVRCPRCWKHVAFGARFCPRCGSALGMATPPVSAPMRMQPKPPGAGGGVTALLVFLVVGAFGLLVMLFVGSTQMPVPLPPTPVPAQSAYPSTAPPDDTAAEQDQGQVPGYPNSGPYYTVTPRPYQVRPRAVGPYPPAPYPVPDRSHEHEREMHR